ncbi:MAG: thiamine pyrophosphate-dependent dehydrogenase E1 component subunit alpha [Acidobacteria bacterium]|jgi:TPP-dependent pyruvate/acetoin dehydrogenase alpha subunit|nr:thiamine pyrophosphate-dependent dehydrogenase E1 component subunit alpha [Acidobacteriota bacterium]
MELSDLYRQMLRARTFELAIEDLWHRGLISGEMHLGTGEEAVAAGVVTHLGDGEGLALTHRCSPALVVRGVPLVPMLRELLGCEDGICGGRGGHMHLASKEHLAAASGIVGASLPTAAGFALANSRLRTNRVAVAFTGTGAMNSGMALETLNLAAAWSLPLVVVCIDNGWAITTASEAQTGGDLVDRARAFGFTADSVDGSDVQSVHKKAGKLINAARRGKGPGFLLAECPRLDGHILGDPLLRLARKPLAEGKDLFAKVISSATSKGGGGIRDRTGGMTRMMSTMAKARRTPAREGRDDPMRAVRKAMDRQKAERQRIDSEVTEEIEAAVEAALAGVGESDDA